MKQHHENRQSVADSVRDLTDTIESRKEEKQRKRQEKLEAEARKRKRSAIEKSIAPIILVLTILISFIIMVFSQ